MNVLIKIAGRNIWRSQKRSLIIMTAVSIGLWAGIFMIAFYNGMIEERINSAITSELSHIQLHHPMFRKEYEIKYELPEGRKILENISNSPDIKVSAGRMIIKGMMASAAGSTGITINCIMPKEEQLLTKLPDKIIAGNYFDNNQTNQIIISKKISKKLKINLNKKTILTFQDNQGNMASAAFRVCGIYKTSNGPYDDANVFVKIKTIDSLAGIPNSFNEIAILLKSNNTLDKNQKKLQQNLPTIEIKNWKEIAPELGLTVSVGNQMAYILMGIILLALAFGIINTMMMSILERTREIGMLLALGMNKLKIFIMIVLETIFLILLGCPLGLLFAFSTIAITNQRGIDFSKYSEVYSSFGYKSVIYPSLTLGQFGIVMLLIMFTALFSAVLPAIRALKINPAESLKK
jgi:putative ABC transport system permease protein